MRHTAFFYMKAGFLIPASLIYSGIRRTAPFCSLHRSKAGSTPILMNFVVFSHFFSAMKEQAL